ncbi:L,D-transpeptidase [Streptomyces sp. ITFR-16]|uniref:L,D-transpeptidase n=1 Tax=Streptomyces sp. ITFR-16 TaxID=3075198 RepID=UPI00288B4525|nr:L,D-transpeptidase [Streptomyces sp. ITFR-16]WNI21883.1 L,D-transpeptidase [Streptomyces sp. ITFR-16]
MRRPIRTTGAVAAAAVTALLCTAAPAAAVPPADTECTAPAGPYQRQLEKHLGRPVDGRQSPEDCRAIRSFQTANDRPHADGFADLATYRTVLVVEATPDPNAAGRCPVESSRMTCVDMDRQLLWVQTGKRVVFGPVPIRTGRDAQETRPGRHAVYWRDRDHVSTIYDNAPMPYSQFFDGGQALHGHPGDLYDGGGSAGCVNLTVDDAAKLWDLLALEDPVYVWGVKPGTAD